MNTIEIYKKELEEDFVINELNLKEKQMMVPGIRHKWVARLINHKLELKRLKAARKQAIDKLTNDPQKTVILSKTALEHEAENNEVIKKIDLKVEETELMILYLEKVEYIMKNITFDISNLINIIKMETL